MTFADIIDAANDAIAGPVTFLFCMGAFLVTVLLRFPQLRFAGHFWHLIRYGIKPGSKAAHAIHPFHAVFTAMATSIGIGNVVGPALAISIGGPGALGWLLLYVFFGAALKTVEVYAGISFRGTTPEGKIIGGPGMYLREVSPLLAHWYTSATVFLFAGWSGIQSNALAEIASHNGIPAFITGGILSITVFVILYGGAKRVGDVASKAVPAMFTLYVGAALYILLGHPFATLQALKATFSGFYTSSAAVGGTLGATFLIAAREGVYKAVFITESGIGTSAIAHALADVARPLDQAILALYSVAADGFLCFLSGLLAITSMIHCCPVPDAFVVLDLFEQQLSWVGSIIFLVSVSLFIITTAIGNGFNGGQTFALLTHHRHVTWYYVLVACIMFAGSLVKLPLLWGCMDLVLPFVAIPNLIGVIILAYRLRHKFETAR